MIKASGLWKGTDKNGNVYMSGTMGGVRVMIFKNTKKTDDKQPDYYLCLDENRPREEHQREEKETF